MHHCYNSFHTDRDLVPDSSAEHAAALAARLQAADEKLQSFAEAGGSAPFVCAARYPVDGLKRYQNTFEETPLHPASIRASLDGSDQVTTSGDSELAPKDAESGKSPAEQQLAAARQDLQAAVRGVHQLRRDAAGLVCGQDTAELYHFFNQPEASATAHQVLSQLSKLYSYVARLIRRMSLHPPDPAQQLAMQGKVSRPTGCFKLPSNNQWSGKSSNQLVLGRPPLWTGCKGLG